MTDNDKTFTPAYEENAMGVREAHHCRTGRPRTLAHRGAIGGDCRG